MANQQGPEVTLELSCRGCEHLRNEAEYDEVGDRSWARACGHPDMPAEHVEIGYTTRTPRACPLRDAMIAATVRSLGFVPVDEVQKLVGAWRRSWDCSRDPGHSIMGDAIEDVSCRLGVSGA